MKNTPGSIATKRPRRADPSHVIRERMHLLPVLPLPEILLYTAHPGSGLRRLAGKGGAPYWAYQWAGGLALARHLLAFPEIVRGRRVLDLGAGSGIVGIMAAKAGAAEVLAAEVDEIARAALALNAAANDVSLTVIAEDLTAGPPIPTDVVLVGDLFYAGELAERVLGFVERCAAAGSRILIGDPGREFLPRERLEPLAEYDVADVGEAKGMTATTSTVFTLLPPDDCGRRSARLSGP